MYNQIVESGTPYIDQDFLPEFDSIAEQGVDTPKGVSKFRGKNLSFKRVTEMYDNAELFKQGVASHDINQGQIGNCYFIAAVSAAAENESMITSRFKH
jgi:hypothetical protein